MNAFELIMAPNAGRTRELRSCHPCHKAKRKCDRSTPLCNRCSMRGLDCKYPRSITHRFVPLYDIALTTSISSLEESPETIPFGFPTPEWETFDAELYCSDFLGPVSEANSPTTAGSSEASLCGAWFLAPETWLVDHDPFPIPPNFQLSDLHEFLELIQSLFKTWVKTGSNSFIHSKLYHERFPDCVQTAYTTLSAYINRTSDNSETVLRIVNSQASAIVATIRATCWEELDPLEHLAQVHALFAYQTIGLLDGDIRSRYVAEQHSSCFVGLLNQLLDQSTRKLGEAPPQTQIEEFKSTSAAKSDWMKRVWQAWTVSESVRRTWLMGMGLNAAYDGLKQGWTVCAGDIAFTSGKEVWEAKSAETWGALCTANNVCFIRRFRAEWMFQKPLLSGVDDFTMMMLEITYGKDRVRDWITP